MLYCLHLNMDDIKKFATKGKICDFIIERHFCTDVFVYSLFFALRISFYFKSKMFVSLKCTSSFRCELAYETLIVKWLLLMVQIKHCDLFLFISYHIYWSDSCPLYCTWYWFKWDMLIPKSDPFCFLLHLIKFLFSIDSEIDQLYKIYGILGMPDSTAFTIGASNSQLLDIVAHEVVSVRVTGLWLCTILNS